MKRRSFLGTLFGGMAAAIAGPRLEAVEEAIEVTVGRAPMPPRGVQLFINGEEVEQVTSFTLINPRAVYVDVTNHSVSPPRIMLHENSLDFEAEAIWLPTSVPFRQFLNGKTWRFEIKLDGQTICERAARIDKVVYVHVYGQPESIEFSGRLL